MKSKEEVSPDQKLGRGIVQFLRGFARYLVLEEGLSELTATEYSRDARLFLLHLASREPPVPMLKANASHVRGFVQEHSDVSPYRIARLLAGIAKFYAYLADIEGLAVEDPTYKVKRPKLPQHLPMYLTPEEVVRLIEGAKDQEDEDRALRDMTLIAFLYGTGLRISEALSLKLDDVVQRNGKLKAIRVIGKGNKQRVVALSPTALGALERWLEVRSLVGGERVFVHLSGKRKGQPLSVRTVQLAIKKAAEQAGLDPERVTPHKLRHSYASALVEAGRSLDEVKTLLGHSSISTTQVYVHASDNRMYEATQILPDVLKGER